MLVRDLSDDRADRRPAISVLGALEVRTPGGELVPITARKHVDLLVILTAERSVASAGRLCELLWRGAPPDSAQVTLQGYVLRLRRALAVIPDVRIDTVGGGYVLRCAGPNTDLDLLDVLSRDAREASANGDIERAVALLGDALALWRGDPLTDIDDITDIAPERARLDEVRIELTEMCAEGLIALGRAHQAVAMLAQARQRNPLRESTARLSALVLRERGRAAEALDVLVDVRRRLRDELGLDPSPDSERLEAELRRPPTPTAPAAPESRLFGRESAAARLDRAWQTSRRDLTIVTVRGAAGIGKSAVVVDAVRRHQSGPLFTGGAERVKGAALEAVSAWLDQAAIDGHSVPDRPSPRALAALLAEMARDDGHVVAVVDNVQWVDVDSLRMITGAARILRGRPVLLILIARSDPLPDELAESVETLQSAGIHQRIELSALPDRSVGGLVDAELGPRSAEVRDTIVRESGGSPFVAVQLCDLVRAGRDLTPATVSAGALRIKLDSLSRSARELAELLAVSGTATSVAVAMAAHGSAGVDAGLPELTTLHLVALVDGTIDYCHDLIRAEVLNSLSAHRTAQLHRGVAVALELCSPDALTAIATHRSIAAGHGTDPEAAAACAAAAESALQHSAFRECTEHAMRGLRHAPPRDTILLSELESLAGQAYTHLGEYGDAAECFERAGRHRIADHDWVGLGRTVLMGSQRGVGGYFSGYGVVQSGSVALRTQALAHRRDLDREMIAELLAVSAVEHAVHGSSDDLDLLAEAFEYTERGSGAWQEVKFAEFICTWDPTTVAERSVIADELADLAGDRRTRATALHLRRVCALESGDLRLVRRLSAEFARLAADGGADATAMAVWWQVMIAVLRGRYEQSQALMRQMADGLSAVDGPARMLAEASLLTANSIELWHKGRLAEALPEVDRMTEDFDDDFALVAAMAYAEIGRHDRALGLIERLMENPGRLHGPRLAIRVPLLIEALLVIGAHAPHRSEVERFARRLEPYTAGWGEALLVQWPGLVCLGPSGLYRGTIRGILGRPDATDLVTAAMRRARVLGAHPYEQRAAQRLTRWPFVR